MRSTGCESSARSGWFPFGAGDHLSWETLGSSLEIDLYCYFSPLFATTCGTEARGGFCIVLIKFFIRAAECFVH